MTYRGNFKWIQVCSHLLPDHEPLQVGSDHPAYEFQADFEFESDLTDWNDLRPLVLQAFNDLPKPHPEIILSCSLRSIHLEEVKDAH